MNTPIVNFFDLSTNNNEPLRTDSEFGLCDNNSPKHKEEPAYSNNDIKYRDSRKAEDKHLRWVATVVNSSNIPVRFYAIDKRIQILINGDEQSLCDGMLVFNDKLYLVELKVKKEEWLDDSINQLRSTISFLQQYHTNELAQFKSKKAYACNRKHPNFALSHAATMNRFYQETGFRLDIQATIHIK